MIDKRDIINFLFVVSFPFYGIGNYISASISPSVGYFISIAPHILIIIFYFIDLLYKKTFSPRLNSGYFLVLLFQLSCVASLFIALGNNLPEASLRLTIARSVSLLTPFHAFIIVALYNDRHADHLPRLTLISLTLLLAINLVAFFGFGLINASHSIEGRLSLPFFDGFYSGANTLAVINLILLFYLFRSWRRTGLFVSIAAYFAFNFILFYLINSRLSMLIFLLVLILVFLRLIRSRGVYVLSMFTVPILLASGAILYNILSHPFFVSLIQRVDIDDVTTFNGRAFLWQDALDWLIYDQRGFWLGNGYKGHYFLDLIPDVVKLWNAENSHHLHLHSTSLETLVCQGLVFFIVLCIIFYHAFKYYRRKHQVGSEQGAFYPVIVFLLFIMQVDTFLYLDGFGAVIFALLISRTVVSDPITVNTAGLNHSAALSDPRGGVIESFSFNKNGTIQKI